MVEEERLIEGCIAGDRKCQRLLYEKYASRMYVVCLRYSKTNFEAEDILQESFVKIFDHIKNFKGESTLGYWIKRVVINTALKANRRKIDQAPKEDVTVLRYEISEDEDLIISNFSFNELLSLIQRLAPSYQTIFNLYAIEGFKHKEIAEMLGISEGTSKSQYARAKTILQTIIEKEYKHIYERAS